MSAISAGVNAGIDVPGLGDIARGALGSIVTQGIGVATGLQSKFDFAGVAAAAVGAGVGGAVARGLPNIGFLGTRFGNDFASTTASAIGSAATRSAIEGSSFGANLAQALPDAIGQTLGRALTGAIGGGSGGSMGGGIRIDPGVTAEITRQLDGSAAVANIMALNDAIAASPVARSGVSVGQHAAHIAASGSGAASYAPMAIDAPIIVNADPHQRDMLWAMNGGQYQYYRSLAGDTVYNEVSAWKALSYSPPSVYVGGIQSYDTPLIQSLKMGTNISHGFALSAAAPDNFLGHAWRSAQYGFKNNMAVDLPLNVLGSRDILKAGAALSGFIRGGVDYLYPDNSTLGTQAYIARQNASTPFLQRTPTHSQLNGARGLAIELLATGPAGGLRGIAAAESAAPRIIEGVDASTLVRGHSIGGSSSIKRVGKIADSMRVDGYIGDPIRVIQSDGRMIIVDGHHRTAAARMTNTPVNVEVVGPEAFPMGSGGWQSIEEVIQSAQTAGSNRLNKPGRKW
ncbi:ParB/RepB/Spo0J family partition protein [Caenibius sp. WL]|uniref:ParB/RepB/Spo0J family partition protein n=1 Tax=Caenibius sp. WL TaxID=2872646 RepID=UPI001C996B33|nr:ParB/RepB/Spo0J family partition protein [Caenibius sp. WL]QZP08485.1 ParB/RepB/Spo0J family partition protein [Caenibius sp. WL]